MSIPLTCVCRSTARITHRTQWLALRQIADISPRNSMRQNTQSRYYRSTAKNLAAEETKPSQNNATEKSQEERPYFNETFYSSLFSSEKQEYLNSTPLQRKEQEEGYERIQSHLGLESKLNTEMDAQIERQIMENEADPDMELPPRTRPKKNYAPEDFHNRGEPDRDAAPEDEFKFDDITEKAHGELDMHREAREYMRLAAWEMPLLSSLAKPYQAPDLSKTPLRWRYLTHFATPHPSSTKVVLTFRPCHLRPLHLKTSLQISKLIKLAGPRYDPLTDTVKMTSESFQSQAQNKRYIGDQFMKLLNEARCTDGTEDRHENDLTKQKGDMMRDIPFDFRHARRRMERKGKFISGLGFGLSNGENGGMRKMSFPKEWNLTVKRKEMLDKSRTKHNAVSKSIELMEGQGREEKIIDGLKIIDDSLITRPGQSLGLKERESVMVKA